MDAEITKMRRGELLKSDSLHGKALKGKGRVSEQGPLMVRAVGFYEDKSPCLKWQGGVRQIPIQFPGPNGT